MVHLPRLSVFSDIWLVEYKVWRIPLFRIEFILNSQKSKHILQSSHPSQCTRKLPRLADRPLHNNDKEGPRGPHPELRERWSGVHAPDTVLAGITRLDEVVY